MFRILCLLAALASSSVYASQFEVMNYYTEDFPNYTFRDKERNISGYSVELLDNVLNELNVSSQNYRIKMYPWVRAYKQALKNEYPTMLFLTTKTEEREGMFKWAGPVASTKLGVFSLSNKDIKIKEVEDLNKYKIGVIKSDYTEQILLSEGVDKKKIQVSTSFESILKKTKHGRIDVFVYDIDVAQRLMDRYGFDFSEFKIVSSLRELDLYFAFNKAVTDKTVEEFQTALDGILSDEDLLAAIQDNYS